MRPPCALVVFGNSITRPTIVCIQEDALPQPTPADWVMLARDSDVYAGTRDSTPPDPSHRRRASDP